MATINKTYPLMGLVYMYNLTKANFVIITNFNALYIIIMIVLKITCINLQKAL